MEDSRYLVFRLKKRLVQKIFLRYCESQPKASDLFRLQLLKGIYNTKGVSNMIKSKASVLRNGRMEFGMKVNGLRVKQRAAESYTIPMEIIIRVISLMTKGTALDSSGK